MAREAGGEGRLVSLAEALERAATRLGGDADAIRPANGDPVRLLQGLDGEGAVRLLGWLLREDPTAAGELALAWAELPRGGEALLGVDERDLPKRGRKILRRALHRLRSRGLDVETVSREPVVATVPAVDEKVSEARVTRVDPSGAQLLVLAESQASGGVRVVEAIVDDERGILEFHVLSTGRSPARRLLRELATGVRLPAVEASPASVRARLARVAARHPADRPVPGEFQDWRGRIQRESAGVPTPGEVARAALGEAPSGLARESVLQLIEQGELGPWPPPAEILRDAAERLHEVARSRLVLSEEQRREQVDDVIRELRETRFGSEGAAREADRLDECAYGFWKQGRDDDARSCLGVATELRRAEAPAHPVARALLDRALRPLLEALREEEESSLLVKP